MAAASSMAVCEHQGGGTCLAPSISGQVRKDGDVLVGLDFTPASFMSVEIKMLCEICMNSKGLFLRVGERNKVQ